MNWVPDTTTKQGMRDQEKLVWNNCNSAAAKSEGQEHKKPKPVSDANTSASLATPSMCMRQ